MKKEGLIKSKEGDICTDLHPREVHPGPNGLRNVEVGFCIELIICCTEGLPRTGYAIPLSSSTN